jgi:hypothetical protein
VRPKKLSGIFGPGAAIKSIAWRQAPGVDDVTADESELRLSFDNAGGGSWVEIETTGTFAFDSPDAMRSLADLADALRKAHEDAGIFG